MARRRRRRLLARLPAPAASPLGRRGPGRRGRREEARERKPRRVSAPRAAAPSRGRPPEPARGPPRSPAPPGAPRGARGRRWLHSPRRGGVLRGRSSPGSRCVTCRARKDPAFTDGETEARGAGRGKGTPRGNSAVGSQDPGARSVRFPATAATLAGSGRSLRAAPRHLFSPVRAPGRAEEGDRESVRGRDRAVDGQRRELQGLRVEVNVRLFF